MPTPEKRHRNYWPLAVVPASLALWWGILASVLGMHIATVVVTGAACAIATIAALSHLLAYGHDEH